MVKILFFDLETTGVKYWKNDIHQVGGIVDIDGKERERFDIRVRPNPQALEVAGVTMDEIMAYQPMKEGYRQLVGILSRCVSRYRNQTKQRRYGRI